MTPRRIYYGWIIVAVIFCVNMASNVTASFTFGLFIIPMSEDLDVSRGAIGFLPTARLIGTGIASFFLGKAADRYGSRLLIPGAALISATALIGVSQSSSYLFVIIIFGILGLFDTSSPGNVLTSVPIAKWFIRHRGRATAIVTLGFALGGGSFAILHERLINAYGWRTTLVISAIILAVIVVPTALMFMRRQPEDMGANPDGDINSDLHNSGQKSSQNEVQWTLVEAIKTLSLWKLAIAFALINFSTIGFIVHRTAYWNEGGIETSLIAIGFAADSAGFATSALIGGMLVERFPARFLGGISAVAQGVAVVLAIFWFSAPSVILIPLLFGLASGTGVVVQTVIWADYFGRQFQGAIRGFVVPIALVGMGLGPPIIGILYDLNDNSYFGGFSFAVVLLLIAGVALASAAPPRKAESSVINELC
ncbi:MAG: hypothetical protein CL776_05245 [Chloroflexi bacterium]|nr:hypothetical protein [Chloroflexota bacterium]